MVSIDNVKTDNGSELLKHFDQACSKLKINHYFSRSHTPKDNAVCERFNRILQEEFINQGRIYQSRKNLSIKETLE